MTSRINNQARVIRTFGIADPACRNFFKHHFFFCNADVLVAVLLPARASEQGNVIGGVRVLYIIYICHQKKIVIERSRDLIYLKFVATDFSLKIISPSAGENSGDLA